MTTKRTDIHRPSAIDPGEYALTGNIFDLKYDNLESMEVGTKPYGHCNHCGKAIRWAVEFRHESGEVVVFGEICADVLSLSDSRTKHEMVLLKRRVANLEKEMRRKEERDSNFRFFSLNQPEVTEWLMEMGEKDHNHFIRDLKRNLDQYGMLTTRQVEAWQNVMKRREEDAERRRNEVVPESPVAEGRYEIKGEVFTKKWEDDYRFGGSFKIGIKLPDGNKVYGTLPRALENTVERGHIISLVATVTRSKKDEHFGYYKRPSNAKVG